MQLSSKIEALLFYRAEPVSLKELGEICSEPSELAVEAALHELEQVLVTRGVRLMRVNDSVLLVTAPEMSELLEQLTRAERERDLSRATVETLAIVMYRGPISRTEIDHIRGVNSTFTLRQLTVRGLVERITNPDDQRSFLYQPTFDLLSHLGVTKREDMPEYESFIKEIISFIKTGDSSEEKHTVE
jgi:segregation and condensation protein B